MSIRNLLRYGCFLSFFGIVVLFNAVPTAASVIHVPAAQPTIQAGIDAAVNGDTVLVADGLFTGPGNRDVDFLGKAITVRSEYGPDNCIVDCGGSQTKQHRGFVFQSGEGRDSVLQGFTIRNGDMGVYGYGGGVYATGGASPSILDNVITANRAWWGAGLVVGGSSLVAGNIISGNVALAHNDPTGVGGGISCIGTAEVVGNIISDNFSGAMAGGIACFGNDHILLANNLIVGNRVELDVGLTIAANGGGVGCDVANGAVTIINCTIAMNQVIDFYSQYGHGGGMSIKPPQFEINHGPTTVTVENSIIFGNSADFGAQCYVGNTAEGPAVLSLEHSDLDGGEAEVLVHGSLIWGPGMIDADPLFAAGPLGDWYLQQVAAGQAADSPCLDSGNAAAGTICHDDASGTVCLDQLGTRTDQVRDGGVVDMGFHYMSGGTVGARLQCTPAGGVLPFLISMAVSLDNRVADQPRRLAGRIDVLPASGGSVANWRAGYTNVAGGQSYTTSWVQNIPALPTLVGENVFTIVVADVTSAPYNQPPYAASGDTMAHSCAVTGDAPYTATARN